MYGKMILQVSIMDIQFLTGNKILESGFKDK